LARHKNNKQYKEELVLELRILLTKFLNLFYKRGVGTEKKADIVRDYIKKFQIDTFIESGTYIGDMIHNLSGDFKDITSIELSDLLYKRAKKRFNKRKHIKIIHGDSAVEIKKILSKTKKPLLFWLDAHCSRGVTAMSRALTPIKEELKTILKHKIKRHVILIDDSELFVGKYDYPTLKDVKNLIKDLAPSYKIEDLEGVIRIYPKKIFLKKK
jgi:hypothetical protein